MYEEKFSRWCLLEVKGHRQLAGLVTEEQVAGTWWLKVEIPDGSGESISTQFFSPWSIFSMTPTTFEVVKDVVKRLGSRGEASMDPVGEWERTRRRTLGLSEYELEF